jgi:taurine--2-oxoglutarate transaminase
MKTPSELTELIANHTYGSWKPQKGWKTPLFISRAEGVRFWDAEGTAYLDFSSQLMCSNLGHGNRAIIEAIREQADTLPYVAPGFICEAKARATEALLEAMPEGVDQFFFSTSGTEANEAALKIIGQYMGAQGKYKVISRYRSYHGSTSGSIALTGDPRRWFAEPMTKIPGVIFAPDAYCYRCPFSLTYPGCGLQCAEYVDYMIKEEGNVAAIVIEPVVGTNGVIVPPNEYLPRLRQIADDNGVLLVADEVMSGWYRTGAWFAVDNWNVKPDIITTAKGCTGAYAPVGITATTRKIRDYFEERFFSHGHTYAMHPLVLAAIPPAVQEYKKLAASGAMAKGSAHLASRLRELMDRHPSIGDVRGMGHFWAVELVRDRETKEPFNTKADKAALKPLTTDRLSGEMLKRGLHLAAWYNHFIIAPPLTITPEEIDEGIGIFDDALAAADREADTTE